MRNLLKQGLLLVVLLLGMAFQLTAQSTYVHVTIFLNDGTEATYDMHNSSYMYFEEGVRLVITESIDGMNDVSYPLSDIRKITCEEMVGTLENTITDIEIYPSPVHDVLCFRNVSGTQNVKIYALDGHLVKSLQITGDQSINISGLSIGLYLVKTQTQTLKMIKL